MTTIPWIKCSDRMPPDDESVIIVRDMDGLVIKEGYIINAWADRFDETAEWIPYDEATWQELNRCS